MFDKDNPNINKPPQKTAAELDAAWEIYLDSSKTKEARISARNFMIHLLDLHHYKLLDTEDNLLDTEDLSLKKPNILDELLRDLMHLRFQHKEKGNVDYIPI